MLAATGPEGSGRDDVPGLAALYDADVLVLSMRRRSLPVVQMDHLERFIRAGKPLVVLRTSAAAFQTRKDPELGYVVWDRFDQEVLGCNYQGYNAQSRETGCYDTAAIRAISKTRHSSDCCSMRYAGCPTRNEPQRRLAAGDQAHRKPCMDIEVAHRVANLCNLGNLSYILGRKLTWDGRREQFLGDEDAQRMLSRPQHAAYQI